MKQIRSYKIIQKRQLPAKGSPRCKSKMVNFKLNRQNQLRIIDLSRIRHHSGKMHKRMGSISINRQNRVLQIHTEWPESAKLRELRNPGWKHTVKREIMKTMNIINHKTSWWSNWKLIRISARIPMITGEELISSPSIARPPLAATRAWPRAIRALRFLRLRKLACTLRWVKAYRP